MKLRNRFKNEDKARMWMDDPFCAVCQSNNNCSLHHINGCKKFEDQSLLNSIMLCEKHHKEADAFNSGGSKGEEMRAQYREIALNLFIRNDLKIHQYDQEYFFENHPFRSEQSLFDFQGKETLD